MIYVCLCYAVLSVPSLLVRKELTSLLSSGLCFLVFCHFPIWCHGSGTCDLDCIDSGSLPSSTFNPL